MNNLSLSISSRAAVLSRHIDEHNLNPCPGDDLMLLDDIRGLRHTLDEIQEKIEQEEESKKSANRRI